MKSVLSVLLAVCLASCVTGATPRVVTETPASISYECIASFGGCQASPQDVANSAQDHCKKFGKNAQQTQMGVAPSGNFKASFNCV